MLIPVESSARSLNRHLSAELPVYMIYPETSAPPQQPDPIEQAI